MSCRQDFAWPNNFGSPQVDALEAFQVRSSFGNLLLESGDVGHHGDGLVGVEVGLAVETGQSKESFLRVRKSFTADEPPGWFRSKCHADQERYRSHPVERVGNAIHPLVGPVQHAFDDANCDQLSQSPAEVDIRREVPTQSDGADLGGTGNGERLEHSPRILHRIQATRHRLPIAEPFANPAVDEEADHPSNVGAISESSLPACWDLIRRIGYGSWTPRFCMIVGITIAAEPPETTYSIERIKSIKAIYQGHIIPFHRYARRNPQRPPHSFEI